MIRFNVRRSAVDYFSVESEQILDYGVQDANTITGEELPVGIFEATFVVGSVSIMQTALRLASGYDVNVVIEDEHDGTEKVLTFFLESVECVGDRRLHLIAQNIFGLLDRVYHAGGIYTGQSLTSVVGSILGLSSTIGYESEITIIANTVVNAVTVTGYLPYDTGRKNLQRLCVAYGVVVRQRYNGQYEIIFPEIYGVMDENSTVELQPTADQLEAFVGAGLTYLFVENDNKSLTAYAFGAEVTGTIQCTVDCGEYGVRLGTITLGDSWADNGSYYSQPVTLVYSGGDLTAVPDTSECYDDLDVSYPDRVTSIDLTEHTYRQTELDEAVTLFDNTQGSATADHDLVIFDPAPIYGLEVEGPLTIDESGVNYAIVSGSGVLTGKQFFHSRRVLSVSVSQGKRTSVLEVDDVGVITGVNSWNAAQRLLKYYNGARLLDGSCVTGLGVTPLKSIVLPDPSIGRLATGLALESEISPSAIVRSKLKAIMGYIPGPFGNNFTHAWRSDEDATWTVPPGVERIRVMLVGGGQGGQGGYGGEDGYGGSDLVTGTDRGDNSSIMMRASMYYQRQQLPAAGGVGGEAGIPGRVYITDLTVAPGDTISVAPGAGGAGGAANGGIGSAGEESTITGTFGTLSSQLGERMDAGYADMLSGAVYGKAGKSGDKGGDGGLTCAADLFGVYGASSKYSSIDVPDERMENGGRGGSTYAPATGITVIPKNTFTALPNVELVILPEGLEEIEDTGIRYTSATAQIVFPASIKKVGKNIAYSSGTDIGIWYYAGHSDTYYSYGDWANVVVHPSNEVIRVVENAPGPGIPAATLPILAEGPLGNHLTWAIDSGGILWVYGEGPIWTEARRTAWYAAHPDADDYTDYASTVTAIIFAEPVGVAGGAGGNGRYYTARVRDIWPDPVGSPNWHIETWLCRAASGGAGGGASNAAAGSAGTVGHITENGTEVYSPTTQQEYFYNPDPGTATGGDGGDGADATAPADAAYGCGGDGGNGGGGGGNGGGAVAYMYDGADYSLENETVVPGNGGDGGSGSVGGKGGSGLVCIFY